jgi:hypothetical protein
MLCSLSLSYHRTPLHLGKLFLVKKRVFSKCLRLKLGQLAQSSVRRGFGRQDRLGFASSRSNRVESNVASILARQNSLHQPDDEAPFPCLHSFAKRCGGLFGTGPLQAKCWSSPCNRPLLGMAREWRQGNPLWPAKDLGVGSGWASLGVSEVGNRSLRSILTLDW